MNLEEIQAKISENAIKATEILEQEDSDIEVAQKMLNENEELSKKADMLKALSEIPTTTNSEVKKVSDIIIPGSSSYKNVKVFSPESRSDKEKMGYAFGQLAKMVGRNDKKAHQW